MALQFVGIIAIAAAIKQMRDASRAKAAQREGVEIQQQEAASQPTQPITPAQPESSGGALSEFGQRYGKRLLTLKAEQPEGGWQWGEALRQTGASYLQ